MSEKIRIVLVGGGTGGHFYPLIAVAEEVRDRPDTDAIGLYYCGPHPYNQDALTKHNINFVRIPAGKRRKYFSLLNFVDFIITLTALPIAIVKLYRLYPDVVFSKGSYTSVPVVLAAWLLRIPIVVHESDSRPGTANRLAARFARYIGIGFAETADHLPPEKTALVGIPTRRELFATITNPHEQLQLPKDKPVIFVTGGSLGAQRINELVLESLDELLPYYTILHQTGPDHTDLVKQTATELVSDQNLLSRYFVVGTLTADQMQAAHTAAAIIISRAGASSIHEIALHGTPSIIIPIPEAISHDQRSNAYAYARSGAAVVLEQENLTDGLLSSEITRVMSDENVYKTMSEAAVKFAIPNAAAIIGTTLLEISADHV